MDEQRTQAYKALFKWAERLNAWMYSIQAKKKKLKTGQKLKQFTPNEYSLILIEALIELCKGTITADEAMALLWTVEGKTQLNLCMEAGF
jgi:hypothetical protein